MSIFSKLLRYFRHIFSLSFLTWMQYPADFFVSGIGSIMYTVMQITLFYFMFISSSTGKLGDYTFQEFYLVFLISQWATALFFFLSWENLSKLRKSIEQFDLDISLTKPLSPNILILFPRLSISSAMPMLFIQSVLTLGLFFIGFPPSIHWYHIPLFFLWILLGYFLIFAMVLFAVSLQFFIPGFQGLWKLTASMSDTAQYPRTLFPEPVQLILMALLPFLLIADPLYSLFLGNLTLQYFMAHVCYALFYIGFCYSFWRYGLRKYGK